MLKAVAAFAFKNDATWTLSSNAPLDKNTIFCWFYFPQVVQKQTLGAVGN